MDFIKNYGHRAIMELATGLLTFIGLSIQESFARQPGEDCCVILRRYFPSHDRRWPMAVSGATGMGLSSMSFWLASDFFLRSEWWKETTHPGRRSKQRFRRRLCVMFGGN